MPSAPSSTVHPGRCHCGVVRFAARLADGVNGIRRRNRFSCRVRGAVIVPAATGARRLLPAD